MQNATPRKQWIKPELTVLMRTRSEEAVLETCKNLTPRGKGGPNDNNMCASPGNGNAWCRTSGYS